MFGVEVANGPLGRARHESSILRSGLIRPDSVIGPAQLKHVNLKGWDGLTNIGPQALPEPVLGSAWPEPDILRAEFII